MAEMTLFGKAAWTGRMCMVLMKTTSQKNEVSNRKVSDFSQPRVLPAMLKCQTGGNTTKVNIYNI